MQNIHTQININEFLNKEKQDTNMKLAVSKTLFNFKKKFVNRLITKEIKIIKNDKDSESQYHKMKDAAKYKANMDVTVRFF